MYIDSLTQLNTFLFGSADAGVEQELYNEVSGLRQRIREITQRLQELPSLRNRVLKEENIHSFGNKWDNVEISNRPGGTYGIRADNHHVNFLYGNQQDSSNIQNGAVIFQTMPRYTTLMQMTPSRAVTLSNQTNLSNLRDSLHNVRPLAFMNVSPEALQAFGGEVPAFTYSLRRHSSYNLCHPHAQGTAEAFTSICYGNNKWAEALQAASNATDFLAAVDRMLIWMTSANMQDMYGSTLSEHLVLPQAEPSRFNIHHQYINEVFRSALRHVFYPAVEMLIEMNTNLVADGYEVGLSDIEDAFADILDAYTSSAEYASLYNTAGIIETFTSKALNGSAKLDAPAFSLLLNKRLLQTSESVMDHFPGYIDRDYVAALSLLAFAKRIYALWLTYNTRYVPRNAACLEVAALMDAYNVPHSTSFRFETEMTALLAPRTLYRIYQHFNPGNTGLPEWLGTYN